MFGLKGPCVSIDTACSSGLVAAAQVRLPDSLNMPASLCMESHNPFAMALHCYAVMLCVSVQAHNALMLGVTTNAVAAAANLLLSAHTHAMFSVAGKLTQDIMLKALGCI